MRAQAQALRRLGAKAVLIKGGHAKGATATDLLLDQRGRDCGSKPRACRPGTTTARAARSPRPSAAELAKGASLREAVTTAKAYVTGAIAAADELHIGKGRGPVHHFHAWWPRKA